MQDAVDAYLAAWNEVDRSARGRLLETALTGDVELVDPRGRARGTDAIDARISSYQEAMPTTEILLDSGLDAHNDLVRYSWRIVDAAGQSLMEGIDVAEVTEDGRLRRILMFHGPLPPRASDVRG